MKPISQVQIKKNLLRQGQVHLVKRELSKIQQVNKYSLLQSSLCREQLNKEVIQNHKIARNLQRQLKSSII